MLLYYHCRQCRGGPCVRPQKRERTSLSPTVSTPCNGTLLIAFVLNFSFAPTLVPALTNWLIKGIVIVVLGISFANSIMFSPNLAVLSSKSYFLTFDILLEIRI